MRGYIEGGFGSAGAGNRSLRRTATAAGVGTTHAVANLQRKHIPQGRLDNPPTEDIRRSITSQQCCFCDDVRTFKSLSLHWSRGHGIDLQEIRDILGVHKAYGFVSDDLSRKMSERARRLYDPEKLKPKGGKGSRSLSKFGVQSQRKKLELIPEEDRAAQRRRAAVVVAERYTKSNVCIICGQVFRFKGAAQVTVCSPECNEVRRQKHAPHEFPMNRKMKPCKWCGKEIWGHRVTCSDECAKASFSNFAKGRVAHITLMLELSAQARAARPPRYCEADGCGRPYLSRGLCGKHYQRLMVSEKKEVAP